MIGEMIGISDGKGRVRWKERTISEKEFQTAKGIVDAYRRQQLDKAVKRNKLRSKY
jgi:hypothetical protein